MQIDRLQSTKVLHEHASQFGHTLTLLDQTQQQLTSSLGTQSATLSAVR